MGALLRNFRLASLTQFVHNLFLLHTQSFPQVLMSTSVPEPHWDLFCAVVDNFGDVGVCWRLARELVSVHGKEVRLWIDDLKSASRLIAGLDPTVATQAVDGVEICRWDVQWLPVKPGEVVVATFACALPDAFLEAMAKCARPPRWVNLEYLSAEAWVAGCHRLASPHARLPLTQYFFFPGFDASTGGLLREAKYDVLRATFDAEAFRQRWGLQPRAPGELLVSLFSYENPALAELLDAWSRDLVPVVCLVPEGRVLPGVAAFFGFSDLRPGDRLTRGSLTVQVLPFVPQPDYDALLWACDLNFVRGEDSFVRAQWAEHPFVWHIYAQEQDAHLAKLQAFLDCYLAGLPLATARAVAEFWLAWNRGGDVAGRWPGFVQALPLLGAHGRRWAESIAAAGDLASNLVQFCEDAIE